MTRYFCNNNCPCKADRKNFPNAIIYTFAAFKSNGTSVITNCANGNPVGNKKSSLLSFIGWMEEKLGCSGICSIQPWYYFSDVNRGKPDYKCEDKLLDYVDGNSYKKS